MQLQVITVIILQYTRADEDVDFSPDGKFSINEILINN